MRRGPHGHVVQLLCSVALSCALCTCSSAVTKSTPSNRDSSLALARIVPQPPTKRSAGRVKGIDHVVVVTIDGVRWQDLEGNPAPELLSAAQGEDPAPAPRKIWLPRLHQLIGARGFLIGGDDSPVTVSSPSTVSLPSYSELFSGEPPSCSSNDCPATDRPTFIDRFHEAFPDAIVAVVSAWSAIARVAAVDTAGLWISAGRSSNLRFGEALRTHALRRTFEEGRSILPAPGTDDYRPDHQTAALALEILEEHAPDLLFLGLGDTDEYAHQGRYRDYLNALTYADQVIGEVDDWLVKRERAGSRTLLLVTTDHGRSYGFKNHGRAPEAARIWALFAGSSVKLRGRPTIGPKVLSNFAPTIERAAGLAVRNSAFGALPLEGVQTHPPSGVPGIAPGSEWVAELR